MRDYNDQNEFSTSDIDLAACIAAITTRYPTVSSDTTTGLGLFVYKYDDVVQEIITAYASGKLTVNARFLLAARRRLFKSVRALR